MDNLLSSIRVITTRFSHELGHSVSYKMSCHAHKHNLVRIFAGPSVGSRKSNVSPGGSESSLRIGWEGEGEGSSYNRVGNAVPLIVCCLHSFGAKLIQTTFVVCFFF